MIAGTQIVEGSNGVVELLTATVAPLAVTVYLLNGSGFISTDPTLAPLADAEVTINPVGLQLGAGGPSSVTTTLQVGDTLRACAETATGGFILTFLATII